MRIALLLIVLVNMGGTAQFDRDQPTLELHVYGNVSPPPDPDGAGATRGSWSYSFNGRRPE